MMTTDAEFGTIRIRDLDVTGWLFVTSAAGSMFLAGLEGLAVVTGDGSLATAMLFGTFGIFSLAVADHIARPEIDDRCGNCGDRVRVNSGRDAYDVGVRVRFAGSPERSGYGPLSVVKSRDTLERTYCSAKCAHADLGDLRDDQPGAEPMHMPTREIPQEAA